MIKFVLMLAVLAIASTQVTSTSCASLLSVICKNKDLSTFYNLANKDREIRTLLSNKNAVFTVIAPSNTVLDELTKNMPAREVNTFLKYHIIRNLYPTDESWPQGRDPNITRLAGEKLAIRTTILDFFDQGYSATLIDFITASSNDAQVTLRYDSNKPSPALLSCKGAVYVSDKAFKVPPPPPSCPSFYDIICSTKELSIFRSLVDQAPIFKSILSNKNSAYTLIAPNNTALMRYRNYQANTPGKLGALGVLLRTHVLKKVIKDKEAFLAIRGENVDRIAGGGVYINIFIVDFRDGTSGTSVQLKPLRSDSLPTVNVMFRSNKPNPAKNTCKGVVYITGQSFAG